MQNYVSEELTHFVGRSLPSDEDRMNLLIAILRSGELLDPRYKTKRDHPIFYFDVEDKNGGVQRENYMPEPYFEVREDGPVGANEFVAPEMVCFSIEEEGQPFDLRFLRKKRVSPSIFESRRRRGSALRVVEEEGQPFDLRSLSASS